MIPETMGSGGTIAQCKENALKKATAVMASMTRNPDLYKPMLKEITK